MLEIKEINELGNKLLSEDFDTSPIINSATYDLSQILVDKNSILIARPVGSGKLELILKLINLAKNDRKIVIVSTNYRLENFLKDNKFVDFLPIHISQKYVEDRFNVRNIGEIIKISKKLGTEIINEIKNIDKAVIIIYRANDLSPASNCHDITATKQEFWSSLINTIKFKKNTNLILICDKIGQECEALSSVVDVVVEADINGRYKIKKNII
ncbi:MAG: hypothetical protein RXR31_06120 [Thermoproteota archaeon]